MTVAGVDYDRAACHALYMDKNKNTPKTPARQRPIEQKGVVTDVVVPIVSSGVAGATGAAVANALSKPKKGK